MADGLPLNFYVDDVISTWFSLADVIANSVMWQMLLPLGRCYSHGWRLADVKANVADVIATGLYLF